MKFNRVFKYTMLIAGMAGATCATAGDYRVSQSYGDAINYSLEYDSSLTEPEGGDYSFQLSIDKLEINFYLVLSSGERFNCSLSASSPSIDGSQPSQDFATAIRAVDSRHASLSFKQELNGRQCYDFEAELRYPEEEWQLNTSRTTGYFVDGEYSRANSRNIDMTPDGQWVVISGNFGEIGLEQHHGVIVSNTVSSTSINLPELMEGDRSVSLTQNPVAISPDARYIAVLTYLSEAPDNIYIYDMQQESWQPIWNSFDGSQPQDCDTTVNPGSLANKTKLHFADSGLLTFHSGCSNLVENDSNGASDIFVYDIEQDEMTNITLAAQHDSYNPEISQDGRFISFLSDADTYTDVPCGGEYLYVYDRQLDEFNTASICNPILNHVISGDGTLVHFSTSASMGYNSIMTYNVQTGARNSEYLGLSDRIKTRNLLETNYDGSKIITEIHGGYFEGNYIRDYQSQNTNVIYIDRTEDKKYTVTTLSSGVAPIGGDWRGNIQMGNYSIQANGAMSADGKVFTHGSETISAQTLLGTEISTGEANVIYRLSAECNFDTVYLRGSHNSWSTSTPMNCVEPGVWERTVTFGQSSSSSFKFDIHGDWTENYGDNQPTGNNVDSGTCERTGNNIQVGSNMLGQDVTIRFYEGSLEWSKSVDVNELPQIPELPDLRIQSGDIVLFDASSAFDPDGTIESYLWESVLLGDPVASRTVIFPVMQGLGIYDVTLTVTDNEGATASDTFEVKVGNTAPVADAGSDQAITTAGGTITLNGSGSFDPDGDDIEYFWTQTDGPTATIVSPNSMQTDVVIPAQSGPATLEFALTVRDVVGVYSMLDYVDIILEEAAPECGWSNVYVRGSHNGWGTGTPMTCVGNGIWEATATFTGATPSFKFDRFGNWAENYGDDQPTGNGVTSGTCERTGNNIQVSSELIGQLVTIQFNEQTLEWNMAPAGNTPPVIPPFEDQYVSQGDEIIFDGRFVYDVDGSVDSYLWESSLLSGGQSSERSLTILATQPDGEYPVTLTVTDNEGEQTSAGFTVFIGNELPVPIITPPFQEVSSEGGEVRFFISNSYDPDGAIVQRHFTQVGGPQASNISTDGSAWIVQVPPLPAGELLEFEFTVTDNDGGVASEFVSVNVVGFEPECSWGSLYLRGTHSGWSTSAPMDCIVDGVWEVTVTFGASGTQQFKFDRFGDWTVNYGDNQLTGFGIHTGVAEQTGNNIIVGTDLAGQSVTVSFNENTFAWRMRVSD